MKRTSNFLMMFEKRLPEGRMAERLALYLSLALLFIISSIYFYWFGDGILFFQETKSLFVFSSDYLRKFTIKPGGLLEYAGNFFTQVYFSSAYGSLVISSVLILLCLVFVKINRRLSADESFSLLIVLLPSCVLLMVQTRDDHYMHYNLGYILVALYFLVSIIPKRNLLDLIIIALFPLFFYVAGSFSFLYPGMYLVYSLIHKKGILRYLLPALVIVVALFSFIIFKEILFLQPVYQLLGYPLSFFDLSWHSLFFYLLCTYFVIFPWIVKILESFRVNRSFSRIIPLVTILTIFPITVLLLSKYHDPGLRDFNKLEKSVYNQDWDAVIKQNETIPSTNIIGQYYYNLALSEKGQLCNRLFFGRQDFGSKSLTLLRGIEHTNRSVYFYYAIGLISEAHHQAYESLVRFGYRPENIKILIKSELISGNYKIAERYLNILKKTLHYRYWAAKYEKMLYKPELINSDPELGGEIRLLPKNDFFISQNDIQNIELLLMSNPDNKKAFEYKMARLLLDKDLGAVAYHVRKMKEIGYTYIPRHIEEAILVYINRDNEFPDLGGLVISKETELRFNQYKAVYNLNIGNKTLLEKEMKKSGGNTFWYYFQFK
jgi:hypothetical protein